MALLRIVESKQRGECYDCGRRRKIYALQKVFRFVLGTVPGRMEKEETRWGNLCKECFEEWRNDPDFDLADVTEQEL